MISRLISVEVRRGSFPTLYRVIIGDDEAGSVSQDPNGTWRYEARPGHFQDPIEGSGLAGSKEAIENIVVAYSKQHMIDRAKINWPQ